MSKGYLSIEALADYLDCATNTIENWVGQGLLPPPRKIGERTRRWKLAEVDEWLDRGHNGRNAGSIADAVKREMLRSGH